MNTKGIVRPTPVASVILWVLLTPRIRIKLNIHTMWIFAFSNKSDLCCCYVNVSIRVTQRIPTSHGHKTGFDSAPGSGIELQQTVLQIRMVHSALMTPVAHIYSHIIIIIADCTQNVWGLQS